MSLPTNRQDGDVIENEDINALASAINDHEDRLTSVESDSGTSGPGVDIQVGGSQPASGWWLDNGQPLPDGTAPTTPTGLGATATGGSTVNLSWSASSDNVGVTGYNYRIGTGVAVNAGAGTTETVSGLSALTAYSFQVQAYDAQGNVSGWSTAANVTTLDGPDTTAPTSGTLAASEITSTTFTLTVTGASDSVGLHATPYAFSINNGATWSAWQESATHNVTGRTASTEYQARHKVRDAAGNEATGTAITVTTAAPTPLITDDFNRADTSAGTLGTTTTGGKTWVDPEAHWKIQSNKATPTLGQPVLPVRLEAVTPTTSMRATFAYNFTHDANTAYAGEFWLRYDHATNDFYRIQFGHSPSAATINLVAWMAGVVAPVIGGGGSHPAYSFGRPLENGEVVAVDVSAVEEGSNTRLVLKVNGTERINILHTDASRPQGKGIGLNNKLASVRFDDLAIYSA